MVAFDDAAFFGDGLEGEVEFASGVGDQAVQDVVFVEVAQVIDTPEVGNHRLRREQVAVVTQGFAHTGGVCRQFRRRFPLLFGAEYQYFTLVCCPQVFAVAASGGLGDGIGARLCPHQPREADIHPRLNQRGGDEAAGGARF